MTSSTYTLKRSVPLKWQVVTDYRVSETLNAHAHVQSSIQACWLGLCRHSACECFKSLDWETNEGWLGTWFILLLWAALLAGRYQKCFLYWQLGRDLYKTSGRGLNKVSVRQHFLFWDQILFGDHTILGSYNFLLCHT